MSSVIFRDRYRVLRRLGAGGGGSVFEVEDLRAAGRTRVALKVLFIAADAAAADTLGLLRQEFRVLASLRHPAIARVYEFGRFAAGSGLEGSEGQPGYYYTRDLVEGVDLAAYCQPRSLFDVVSVLHQTAEALDILHRAGMVHRDFKPGNVIVDHQGEPHLIDFGLTQGEGQITPTSGTAAYLAPEMLRGERVDRRADLYALGISLYELVSGSLPLPRATLSRLVVWHLDGPQLDLAAVPDAPESLSAIVHRLTHRDPEQRYPSAGELALALADVLEELGGERPDTDRAAFVAPAAGEALSQPLAEAEELARRALAGAIKLVAVSGVPGSGRSTLLRQLAWRMQLADVEVVSGEFQPGDLRPYGLLGDLLGQLSGFADRPNPLRDVGEEREAGSVDDSSGGGAIDRFAIYQQITDFLADVARRVPVLMLLDGFDSADDESRAAVRFVAHTLGEADRVCLLVAHEGHEPLDVLSEALDPVVLAPLAAAEVERMLRDASGRRDARLAGRIAEHTGGNAAFVIDVLRRLHEAGWPTSPDLEALAPPGAVQARLAGRYAELDAEERLALAALAVIGRPGRGAELMRLVEAFDGTERVGLPLERLEASGWLSRHPDAAWAFTQGPARHFVYHALDDDSRRRLHLAAARASDPLGDEQAAIELTRHALAAGELEMAHEHLERVLTTLSALGSYRQAIDLCEQALTLTSAADDRRVLLLELGRLYRLVGDTERAVARLEDARGDQPPPLRGPAAEVALELARAYTAATLADRALTTLDELDIAGASDDERLRVAVLRADALASLGDHEQLLRAADEGLAIEAELAAVSAPRPVARAELGGRKAWSLVHLSRFDEADAVAANALDVARRAGSKRVEANLLNTWGVVAQRAGHVDVAIDRMRQALARTEDVGDIGRVATFRVNIANTHLQRGEYAAALEHFEQSLRLFEAMGSAAAAVVRCNLGFVQLKVGLYNRARVTLVRALEQNREANRKGAEALARCLLGTIAGRRGQLDEARSEMQAARALYEQLGQGREARDTLLDLAELELREGELGAARSALRLAAGAEGFEGAEDLAARAAAIEARIVARDGDDAQRSAAAAALDAAIESAEQLEALELGWTCRAAAVELADARGQTAAAAGHSVAGAAMLQRMAHGLGADQRSAFWQDPWRRMLRERATRASPPLASAATAAADSWSAATLAAPSTGPLAATPASSSSSGDPQSSTLPPTALAAAIEATIPGGALQEIVRAVHERHYRLLEIYRRINAELDPERLLGLVMETAVELTGAERGFLLLGSSPETLEVKIARNLDPARKDAAYSRSIAERVAAVGEPVVTISAHSDPRFTEYASVHQLQLESVCCIPIHAHGRVAGVLYMESRFKSGRFTPEDQRLLMAFGDQVAIALTNAQLMAENQRKAEALEAAKREIEQLAEERGRLLKERTAQLQEARRDLAETRARLEPRAGQFGMVGRSAAMARVFNLIERVAGADVPVLIEGESGTGKEMVARAIHQASARRKKRLVSVNCAAIPENLLESELFGHVRGAFTGADRERKGLFQAADGGSLFLDEISDMPARMQVDLLRALQEHTIRPVGGQRDIKVDVRVIAAANRPLGQLVQRGEFREDLFYRLHVIRVELPPLRDRPDDIPLLVDHFLGVIAERMKTKKRGITKAALRRLIGYGWPGNVRQLEHALMNAAVLADGDVLHEDDFSLESPRSVAPSSSVATSRAELGGEPSRLSAPSDEQRQGEERARILEALERCSWNKSKAARSLGMPRRTFYRRLRAYDIK